MHGLATTTTTRAYASLPLDRQPPLYSSPLTVGLRLLHPIGRLQSHELQRCDQASFLSIHPGRQAWPRLGARKQKKFMYDAEASN